MTLEAALIVIEPLSAATLGGLVYDKAQSAITKWVTTRITTRVEVDLRNRVLSQGRPAKDQQTELIALIKAAVELTAAEQFPGEERLQGLFRNALLAGSSQDWPLVNGSDLTYITEDVYEWILKHDPQPGAHPGNEDPEAHPYLAILCRNIIAQFGFRAENNGAKNTILHPRWYRFWTTELFTSAVAPTPQHAPGLEQASKWPRRFGPLPHLATARLERPVDQELTDALAVDGTTAACQILSGMGGIGKTQIAAHHAHHLWSRREVDLLMWVNAATRESIATAYAHAGSEFCNADPSDSNQAADTFLAWLDAPDAPRWMIILDDLTDPNDLRGLWPPTNGQGRTIVTTRRRDAALSSHTRQRIDVELFTPEQALRYLTNRLPQPELLAEAAELAADLGYLPLALAQAAVYILDQPGTTCARYRALLADRTLKLEQLSPDLLPDDYPHTVTAALQIAIEHADHSEPVRLASLLLAIASLLDPAGIPADLFTVLPRSSQPSETVEELHDEVGFYPPLMPHRTIVDALARLHRLNLIDYDGTTVRIHALVQRTCRDELEAEELNCLALVAATVLVEIWPDIENDPVHSAVLRANVTRLRAHAQPALLQDDGHTVLVRQGSSLGNNGLVNDALDHFKHLHSLVEDALGPDHPHTLFARSHVAYWRGKTGDAAGAASAYSKLLTDFLRVFGPDHPETLTTRNNLSFWHGANGDATGAAIAQEELLIDVLRVLGPYHPDTLITRGNLARWRGRAGDATGAAIAQEELLTDFLRVLGPDHPETLTARSNLATMRGKTGDAIGAATAFAELLIDRLRILGPDHPDTLTARSNLAYWRGEIGDAAGAAIAFEEVLADQIRVLGPDHPDTLTARSNLARWRGRAGDAAGAATAQEELLTDRLRVLGPDHPSTLTTRNNLAAWRGEAGDATGAAAVLAELLTDRLRILGPVHPDILDTEEALNYWRDRASESRGPGAAQRQEPR